MSLSPVVARKEELLLQPKFIWRVVGKLVLSRSYGNAMTWLLLTTFAALPLPIYAQLGIRLLVCVCVCGVKLLWSKKVSTEAWYV